MSILMLLATGGESIPSPTIDCAELRLCQAGDSGGVCSTLKGCADAGEQHRVQWSHTDCNDSYHHIAIHRSLGGGSFVEIQDNVDCCQADPDGGCCEFFWGGCADDCNVLYTYSNTSSGSCTTTYQYKVRAETDGTDTELSSDTTGTSTGCDIACIL